MYKVLTSPQATGTRSGRGLLPFEILEIVDRELATDKFTNECTTAYLATVRRFITDRVIRKLVELRRSRGLFEAMERENEWDADTDLSMGASSKSIYFLTVSTLKVQRVQWQTKQS
jgi:DNA-directed RNA polymerase III subunit RPC1